MDTRSQAIAELTGPGSPFEVVVETVLGEQMPVFARRHANLRTMLAATAGHGDAGYLSLGDRTVSYAEHLRLVGSVAAALRDEYGVIPGDRVAIFAANRPEYAVTFWAVVSLGAIVTAYNGWWTPDEVEYANELTEPKLIIADTKRLARIAHLDLSGPSPDGENITVLEIERDFEGLEHYDPRAPLPDTPIAEDDAAAILFTSGTTGRPKGALISHRGLVGFVQVIMATGAVKARTAALEQAARGETAPTAAPPAGRASVLLTSPMFHVSGMFAGIILLATTGTRIVLREGRFDEEDVLRLIQREQITSWSPVGGLGVRLLDHPHFDQYDVSSIRNMGFGGGPTSPAVRERIQKAFPGVGIGLANGYGSSETVASVTSNSGASYEAFPESAGLANVTCELQIRDDAGQPVPDGHEGAIFVRSAYNMLGYWRNPDATSRTLHPGRWLDTGDVGRLDDGMLTINSRARDMIIRGGENIYPIEVENRLEEHPLVAEAAIVGVDHEALGQEVKAIVVPVAGAFPDTDKLAHWVGETLAGFKVPAHWELRHEPLPRNASGKVLKTVLLGHSDQTGIEE